MKLNTKPSVRFNKRRYIANLNRFEKERLSKILFTGAMPTEAIFFSYSNNNSIGS